MNRNHKGYSVFILTCLLGITISIFNDKAIGETKNTKIAASQKRTEKKDVDNASKDKVFFLSLHVLAQKAKTNPARKKVKTLAGINWIEGFITDTENHDVILFGLRDSGRPSLTLDDLSEILKNITFKKLAPYCSLDPRNEDVIKIKEIMATSGNISSIEQSRVYFETIKNAWGPQRVVTGGVSGDSRFAHVMIDADYHMKKLSQGLVQMDNVPSYIDLKTRRAIEIVSAGASHLANGNSMSRFWFHIKGNQPNNQLICSRNTQNEQQPTFLEDTNITAINRCEVTLLTERQRAAADGTLFDSGECDIDANTFGELFSEHFQSMTPKVPEYADLENLFRIYAVFSAITFRDSVHFAGLDLTFISDNYSPQSNYPMPSTYPGQTNMKEETLMMLNGGQVVQHHLTPMTMGGVSMEMHVTEKSFKKDDTGKLAELRTKALSARPSLKTLVWTLQN